MEDISLEVETIVSNAIKQYVAINWPSSIRNQSFGERDSVHRGRGEDFDNIRQYEYGDDERFIDWRLLATTGELVIRQYRPPTQAEVFIIADVGQTMEFGTSRVTKRRLAAELAADVVVSLDKTKDLVGSIIFSRTGIEEYRRPDITTTRLAYATVASILETQQTPLKAGATIKPEGLADALDQLPSSRSLVFVISDFIGLTEGDWQALYDAGTMHDVFCFYVQDERERELPEPPRRKGFWGKTFGWLMDLPSYGLMIEDWDGEQRFIWNTRKNRELYAANFRRFEASVLTHFKESNCRWLIVSTEEGEAAFPKLIDAFGTPA